MSLYSISEQDQLLSLARDSIQHGLDHGQSITIDLDHFSSHLREFGAAFVTLEKHGELRGCIGSVEAYRPLVEDVAEHAWNAAFRDPRFTPLNQNEFKLLQLEISILTVPRDMEFISEQDLIDQIVPGKDGLVLSDGYRRSLFLPAVWEKLPDIESFMSHLKQKAGLSANHWSSTIKFQRFYSFEFSDHD